MVTQWLKVGMEDCMNADSTKEGAEELNLSQGSLRGPLILAKMVTDALEKQKHVRLGEVCISIEAMIEYHV